MGLIAVLLTITLAALAVLSAVRAAHVARSAADLSALAGATQLQEAFDPAAACAEADRVAAMHEVRVLACDVGEAGDVTVTVSARVPLRLGGVGPDHAEGRARAGPAPDPGQQ
ncbi:MAG: flp pilus-assembly TadE/G-like family protein [Janibacter sp.]|nr:flp pilus-assembly TadE/G-like family protein [Janibacter sp.]